MSGLFSLALMLLPALAPAYGQVRQEGRVPRLPLNDTLYTAPYDAGTFVPPTGGAGKQGGPASANIEVIYNGFSAEAQAAFAYAVSIWETHISSPIPIVVQANWLPIESDQPGSQVLGSAGPASGFLLSGPDVFENTIYPAALAEALIERDATGGEPDIIATFNSSFTRWYFGLDGQTPAGRTDFVTVVLHELGHGLGFVGTFEVDDGRSETGNECGAAPAGYGCWGLGRNNLPFPFDRFTEDANEVALLDTTVYPNPSLPLGAVLTSDAVFFNAESVRMANEDVPVDLYAPSNFEPGSSFSHLDEEAFPFGEANSLMTPRLASSEAIHTPGAITCAIFQEMGWPLGEGCVELLRLGLIAFEADVEQRQDDVLLTWRTAGRAPITRFEVQQRYFDDPFETIAAVTAEGPSSEGALAYSLRVEDLPPGRYTFRLRQFFADGTIMLSPEVSVTVELTERFLLTEVYPNPVATRAELTLLVDRAQQVRVEVYNTLGRRVATPFSGLLRAQERLEVFIDAGALSSGVYFVQVVGDQFKASRSVVVAH